MLIFFICFITKKLNRNLKNNKFTTLPNNFRTLESLEYL